MVEAGGVMFLKKHLTSGGLKTLIANWFEEYFEDKEMH